MNSHPASISASVHGGGIVYSAAFNFRTKLSPRQLRRIALGALALLNPPTPPPFAYQLAYAALRAYWFIFRPHVRGVRCLLQCEGKVLLIRHTYGDRRWYFPGGAVRRGESPEAAARREAQEEVGIIPLGLTPIGQYTAHDKHMHDHVCCFSGAAPSLRVRTHRGEVREAGWFAWGALPQDLSADSLRVLEKYALRLKS